MSRIDSAVKSYKPVDKSSALCSFQFTDQFSLSQQVQLSYELAGICRKNLTCAACLSEHARWLGGIAPFIKQEIENYVPYG